MNSGEKIIRILEILKEQDYGLSMLAGLRKQGANPFRILIATVLSVRARDIQTLPVANNLFKKFNSPERLANANINDIEKIIRPIGFYHIKASRMKELSLRLVKDFNGEVPSDEESLLSLPGVGRKVANCVLVYSFDKDAIPIDVHTHRVSNRLGIIKTKTPEATETELMKITPRKYWKDVNELFVLHGQNMCYPRNPNCTDCSINKYCEKII